MSRSSRAASSAGQPRDERDEVLVEERVAGLDAVGHRHAVALVVQQQARQMHLVAVVERLVERRPAAHALEIERHVLVGDVCSPMPVLQVGAEIAIARDCETR